MLFVQIGYQIAETGFKAGAVPHFVKARQGGFDTVIGVSDGDIQGAFKAFAKSYSACENACKNVAGTVNGLVNALAE